MILGIYSVHLELQALTRCLLLEYLNICWVLYAIWDIAWLNYEFYNYRFYVCQNEPYILFFKPCSLKANLYMDGSWVGVAIKCTCLRLVIPWKYPRNWTYGILILEDDNILWWWTYKNDKNETNLTEGRLHHGSWSQTMKDGIFPWSKFHGPIP